MHWLGDFMGIMPIDAVERLQEGCETLGKMAAKQSITQWEIVASQAYGTSVDIERGRIALAAGGGDGGFGIRIIEDGRYGFAYVGRPEEGGEAISLALSIARKSPQIKSFHLPSASKGTSVDGLFDVRVDQLTPDDLLDNADDLISMVAGICPNGVVSGGGVGASIYASALLTSEGIESAGTQSSHSMGIQVTIDEDDLLTSGWEGKGGHHLITSYDDFVEETVEWASETRKFTENVGPTSEKEVVMTTGAISGLFGTIIPQATLGDRQARGESFWTGKIDSMVMEEHLSLVDDRCLEYGANSSSRDGEGLPSQKNVLISNGILKGALWSTRDAAEQVSLGNIESAQSTASANRDGHQEPPYPGRSNLLLTSSKNTLTRDEMVESIADGYLIGSVMGAHTANPTSGDFSVTSSQILRIVDGEIIGALKQAGISGNLSNTLTSGVALGKLPLLQNGWSGGSIYVPDVRLSQGLRVNPA